MLQIRINKRYADVYTGEMLLVADGKETKLTDVVLKSSTNFRYKGMPRELDGFYLIKFKNYGEEGFHFRPMLEHRALEFRYINPKNPVLTSRDVMYLVQRKKVWEEKCRRLFTRGEHLLKVEGYDHREELELIKENYLQTEDFSDLENLDDEDFY